MKTTTSHLLAISVATVWLLGTLTSLHAESPVENSTGDLTSLSLEELMNVEVYSVSRKPQPLSESAAAVFVISQDDIRRSGVTTVPDALRMVPGLQVAKVNANTWAISARGFNAQFANKLLVLIDGRSVYTPLFAGVYWDVQDLPLENIERIEVIRGPGASVWGANAVNGVINIITYGASKTEGVLATGGVGSEEKSFGTIQYGGKLGDQGNYRVYGKFLDRDGSVDLTGNDTDDDWDQIQAGFRADWDAGENDRFTVQGDIYEGTLGTPYTFFIPEAPHVLSKTIDTDVSGGNIVGRWQRTFSKTSQFSAQAYYDRTVRESTVIAEDRDTFDVDLQHQVLVGDIHDIVYGLEYRGTWDSIRDCRTIEFHPKSRHINLFSGFLQDEITVVPDRVLLTLGSKLEYNDHTKFEIQPTARVAWNIDKRQMMWGSVSRAVRTPSRAENDVGLVVGSAPATEMSGGLPSIVKLYGSDDFDSEELLAFELGWRAAPTPEVLIDLTAFYNDYDNLRNSAPGSPMPITDPVPALEIPLIANNSAEGEAYGVELASEWRPVPWWRNNLAYTYLDVCVDYGNSPLIAVSTDISGSSPRHQVSYRAGFDLPGNVEFDAWLYYVDRLPALAIDSYVNLNLRLAWRPNDSIELSVVGQNLLEDDHQEFSPEFTSTQPHQVERGVYGKITLRF
jgi:iron complex outermembrane receptor protein